MRIRRRTLAAAAVGVLAPSALPQGAAAASAPRPRGGVTEVPFQLYFPFPFNATNRQLVQGFIDRTFNAKYRSVRAVWQPGGNMAAVVAGILAGAPTPVVVASCCADWPTIAPFLEPLDSYFRTHNIDVGGIWTNRQLQQFGSAKGLLGVPEDAATQAYVYRQDILDRLGLNYPAPDWTYEEAARLWSACTGTQGNTHRYGATLPWGPVGPFPGLALLYGFGGGLVSSDGKRCALGDPGSIAAGEWAMGLVGAGVVTNGDGTPVAGLAQGTVVFSQGADPSVLWCVENLRGAKWDFLPFPRWPKGPATIFQSNFYGLNGTAPDKEYAWELFQFVAVHRGWSRFYMRLTLAPPAQNALLEEWVSLLRDVAPPLRSKALEYWTEPAIRGEGYDAYAFFRYEPLQAQAIINQQWPAIWQRQVSVSTGFREIARQIDALEAEGAAVEAAQQRFAAALSAAVRAGKPFPAPPVHGLGSGPAPAPHGTLVSLPHGGYGLQGGGGTFGVPTVNAAFAGQPITAERGSFLCRLLLLANVDCPHLSQWAGAGLLVCGDLSGRAAAVGLEVTAAHGVWLVYRSVPGGAWGAVGPKGTASNGGLLAPGIADAGTKLPLPATGNALRRPVWLRLVRQGLTWQAYTSLDGKNFSAAGGPIGIEAGGVWIGIFVTAHNVSFKGHGTVRAQFDHLSFAPRAVYQIGKP